MKKLLLLAVVMVFLSLPAFAEDCVRVDLDIAPQLVPDEVYYFSAELTNCGDETGIIYLSISIDYIIDKIEIADLPIFMAAGETFGKSVPFMLPDCAPSGDAEICVTARSGETEASDCVQFTIFNPGWGLSDKTSDKITKGTPSTGTGE